MRLDAAVEQRVDQPLVEVEARRRSQRAVPRGMTRPHATLKR